MNKMQLEGKWNQIKGAVKQKYGSIVNDDKAFSEGKMDEIIGKIQEKTGRKKEEIEQEFVDWKEENY